MNTLAISVTQQTGSLALSLKPRIRQLLHEQFPEAVMLPTVLLTFTAQQDARGILAQRAEYLTPLLTGLSRQQLAQLNQVAFVDAATGAFLGEYNPRISTVAA